jgi:hypothetical protein
MARCKQTAKQAGGAKYGKSNEPNLYRYKDYTIIYSLRESLEYFSADFFGGSSLDRLSLWRTDGTYHAT